MACALTIYLTGLKSQVTRKFNICEPGAEGIGLTRAEHMFFEGNRIDSVREMILADDDEGRAKALKKIKVFMKKDFVGIFESLEGRPATIRLLDPPLHEFIGTVDTAQKKGANR